MDSFYGGKPGVSFILKGAFKSVQEMQENFIKGEEYRDVWYGEFCLIDTPNKNNKENGQIYRRGTNLQNGLGGAEYIGQIVGPSSGTPYMALSNIQDNQNNLITTPSEAIKEAFSKRKDLDNPNTMFIKYPQWKNINNHNEGIEFKDVDDTVTEESIETYIQETLAEYDFSQNNLGLVPGKALNEQGEIYYNDNIKYTWANVREDNADSDSWFYIGVTIPYLVTDYEVETVSQYRDELFVEDSATVQELNTENHPFYEKWKLGIPKGIKGDSLTDLQVIVPTEQDKIYTIDAIQIQNNGKAKIDKTQKTLEINNQDCLVPTKTYDDFKYDVEHHQPIFVCKYYNYDNEEKPEPILIYVGPYERAERAEIASNGEVTFYYSTKDPNNEEIRKSLQLLCPDDSVFTLTKIDAMGIHNETIKDNQQLWVKYNDQEDEILLSDPINYIQHMIVRPADTHLLVLYNDPKHRFTGDPEELDILGKDENDNVWVNNLDVTRFNDIALNYESDVYWQDLGSIKNYDGLLIGANFVADDLNGQDILDYLNENYPWGLGLDNTNNKQVINQSLLGKIVTFSDSILAIGKESKEFYAYDYNKQKASIDDGINAWYLLGTLFDNQFKDIKIVNSLADAYDETFLADLSYNGILTYNQSYLVNTDLPIPEYWTWRPQDGENEEEYVDPATGMLFKDGIKLNDLANDEDIDELF